MGKPRIRMSLRGMIAAVVVAAILLSAVRWGLDHLGPRPGTYYGSYSYLGGDWKWHEVRGLDIYVDEFGFIHVD